MTAPYRSSARNPQIVVSQRMRAGTGMLALAAVALLLGFTFATTSRLTVSCTRQKMRSTELRVVSCHVTESTTWARSSNTKVFTDPHVVKLERNGAASRVLVDGRPLLDTTVDPNEVERMARETVLYDFSDHAIGHAGGFLLDARVLLASIATATLALLLSIRRHRLVVDRDEERIRATTSIAFLPLRSQQTSLRMGDRVVARVDGDSSEHAPRRQPRAHRPDRGRRARRVRRTARRTRGRAAPASRRRLIRSEVDGRS